MRSIFDLSTPAKQFRFVAIVEAITWVALLIAMFFKWVLGHEEAVAIPGMAHGVVFMIYLVVTVWAAYKLKWSPKVFALAVVAAFPPVATVIFERWAARNGHLAELSTGNSRMAS